MFRYLSVLKLLVGFLALSVCQADSFFNQNHIDEINKMLASQTCDPECAFNLQSPESIALGLMGNVSLNIAFRSCTKYHFNNAR